MTRNSMFSVLESFSAVYSQLLDLRKQGVDVTQISEAVHQLVQVVVNAMHGMDRDMDVHDEPLRSVILAAKALGAKEDQWVWPVFDTDKEIPLYESRKYNTAGTSGDSDVRP